MSLPSPSSLPSPLVSCGSRAECKQKGERGGEGEVVKGREGRGTVNGSKGRIVAAIQNDRDRIGPTKKIKMGSGSDEDPNTPQPRGGDQVGKEAEKEGMNGRQWES